MAMAIDSNGYGCNRLRVVDPTRYRVCSPALVNPEDREEGQPRIEAPLRFSVLNILRPDFGREAILSTKSPTTTTTTHAHKRQTRPPRRSPLPLPRDLTVSSSPRELQTRLSPTPAVFGSHHSVCRDRDLLSTHGSSLTPGLSRSGSLESLASNRSSLTGSSAAGTPSISSAASSVGAESVTSESTAASTGGNSTQSGSAAQSLWPAWVYCTRYSDRPSSGQLHSHIPTIDIFFFNS